MKWNPLNKRETEHNTYFVTFLNDPDCGDGVRLGGVAASFVQTVVATIRVRRADEVVPLVQVFKDQVPRTFFLRYARPRGHYMLFLVRYIHIHYRAIGRRHLPFTTTAASRRFRWLVIFQITAPICQTCVSIRAFYRYGVFQSYLACSLHSITGGLMRCTL